jgi:putative flippase GtrA
LKRNTANGSEPRATLAQFVKFGAVGFLNTAVSYLVYYALVYAGLHYIAASAISFIVSVLNSFFLNNKYVFKQRGNEKRDVRGVLVKTYASYTLTGLVLQNILLFIFVDVLHMSKFVAPPLCLTVTVPLNFVLNKKWAFED